MSLGGIAALCMKLEGSAGRKAAWVARVAVFGRVSKTVHVSFSSQDGQHSVCAGAPAATRGDAPRGDDQVCSYRFNTNMRVVIGPDRIVEGS